MPGGGTNRLLTDDVIDAALDAVDADDFLLLQNEVNNLVEIIKRAHNRGIKVILNLAPVDESVAQIPIELLHTLIVNEEECIGLVNAKGNPCEDVASAFAWLIEHFADVNLLLTQGALGLEHYSVDTRSSQRLDAFSVNAIDETAAGDAFVGYFVAGLLADMSLEASLRCASAAGALAVTQAGAAPSIPHLHMVSELLAGS